MSTTDNPRDPSTKTRYVFVILSFTLLFTVIFYNLIIQRFFLKPPKGRATNEVSRIYITQVDLPDFLEDRELFEIITYFGISFAIGGNFTALVRSYCFAFSFAIFNVVHLIAFLAKAYKVPLLYGYPLINLALIGVGCYYGVQLWRLEAGERLTPTRIRSRTGIFQMAAHKSEQPPSYEEVIRHPDRFPTLITLAKIP